MLPTTAAVRPTTILEAPRLSRALGLPVLLATETFQLTGSFKFRAAYHLASNVPQELILTASSGNFGQALAYACRLLGKRCLVVMPVTSAAVKIVAVAEFGGQVDLVDTNIKSRAARVAELAAIHPEAYVASAYDDPWVIAGNATLGNELAKSGALFQSVVVPIGGGGLSSGIITGLRNAGNTAPVIGAEPLLANDASRSLRLGKIVANDGEPATIADGARTASLGVRNWAILKSGLAGIIEVSEENLGQGVRLLFELANLKAEPTGALGVGALLTDRTPFGDGPVLCVVSGGNVDRSRYREILGV